MGRKVKILYVEDDPEAFLFLKTIFERKLLEVNFRWANNGGKALEILREESVDLIFLDFFLPDIDGLSLLERLKKEEFAVPIVMITGNGSEEVATEAFKRGVIDYIPKNFGSIKQLENRLFSYVDFALWIHEGKHILGEFDDLSKKRDSLIILTDLLRYAVNGTKKTHLLYKSNLNSLTIKKYIWYAIKNEYMQWRREGREGIFVTTPKGIKLVEKMNEVVKLLA